MDQDEEDDNIFQLTWECTKLFERCHTIPSLADNEWLEDREADFRWWANGLKANRTGHSSLDFRVRHRPDIRGTIIGLVSGISDGLDECLRDEKLLKEKSIRSELMAEDERFFYIETNIHLLMEISAAIIQSGSKFRHERADKALVSAASRYSELKTHLAFLVLIGQYERSLLNVVNGKVARRELPCSVAILIHAWLRDPRRLGASSSIVDAVIVRRNRICFARKPWNFKEPAILPTATGNPRHPQLSILASQSKGPREQPPVGSPSSKQGLASALLPLDQPGTSQPAGSATISSPLKRPATSQLNTTAPKKALSTAFSSAGTSTFSYTATGIGSSFDTSKLPEKEREAIQAMAVRSRTGLLMDYPLRPPLPTKGRSFKCPYCCQILSASYLETRTKWRGHIAYDLMPYSCLFGSCRSSKEFYRTREDWIEHMKQTHGCIKWICEKCPVNPPSFEVPAFDSIMGWKEHMVSIHEEPINPSKEILALKLSERRILDKVRCPLCPRSFELRSLEEDDHIAEHIHSLALRALPWDGNSEEVHSEDRDFPNGPLVEKEVASPSRHGTLSESSSNQRSGDLDDPMDIDFSSISISNHQHIPDAEQGDQEWIEGFQLWQGDEWPRGDTSPPPLSLLGAPGQLTRVCGPVPIEMGVRLGNVARDVSLSTQNFAIIMISDEPITRVGAGLQMLDFVMPVFESSARSWALPGTSTLQGNEEPTLQTADVIRHLRDLASLKKGHTGVRFSPRDMSRRLQCFQIIHAPTVVNETKEHYSRFPIFDVAHLFILTCVTTSTSVSWASDLDANLGSVTPLIFDYFDGFISRRGRTEKKLSSSRTRRSGRRGLNVRIINFADAELGFRIRDVLRAHDEEMLGENDIQVKNWKSGDSLANELLLEKYPRTTAADNPSTSSQTSLRQKGSGGKQQETKVPKDKPLNQPQTPLPKQNHDKGADEDGPSKQEKGPRARIKNSAALERNKGKKHSTGAADSENPPLQFREMVSTYRLHHRDLLAYLKLLFPPYGEHDFRISVDERRGGVYWQMLLPRPLTNYEKEDIYRRLTMRRRRNEDLDDFL